MDRVRFSFGNGRGCWYASRWFLVATTSVAIRESSAPSYMVVMVGELAFGAVSRSFG